MGQPLNVYINNQHFYFYTICFFLNKTVQIGLQIKIDNHGLKQSIRKDESALIYGYRITTIAIGLQRINKLVY